MNQMKRLISFALLIFAVNIVVGADWPTNLVWDGGGVWTKRIPITITNSGSAPLEGRPVFVQIGSHTDSGTAAKDLRLTKSDGQELFYGLNTKDGKQITEGKIPENAVLTIPVDCDAGKAATFYLYFGNEKAESVPEFLNVKHGLVNGDVEIGDGRCPDGWDMSPDTETHQNFWLDEAPRSGKKCLKTVVKEGAKSDWTATRQSGIPIVGDAKYRFKGWVRGENVVGRAGWFIHAGNEKNSQLLNQVRGEYKGTFDWTELVFDFTAPKDADTMTLGTVLYGTGTAWFDNVSVELLEAVDNPVYKTEVLGTESIPFAIIPAPTDWPNVEPSDYLCRSTFRIVNSSDKEMKNVPVLATLRGTQAHGLLGPLTDLKLEDGSPVALLDSENFRISCKMSVPAKAIKYFHVYYKFDEAKAPTGLSQQKTVAKESDTAHPELQKAADPLADLPNLVKNGDFEAGFSLPDDWSRNDQKPQEGVRYSIEKSPEIVRFGKQCLRLDVEKYAPSSWRGWTQRLEVEPNHSYLVQGWIKGIDLESARIHLHFLTGDGKHCSNGGMSSVSGEISGTTDWTRVAEVLTTPTDAKFLTIHLTMNGHGTLLHDNIVVVDGLFAEQVGRDSRLSNEPGSTLPASPLVWQVPAVMKVFPQTIPNQSLQQSNKWTPHRIEASRNEKEPLQIALRSGLDQEVEINVVEPPTNATGFKLDQFEISTTGYVRIDYPSNYYNTKTPKWYRKSPTSSPGCDGWSGLWPDPLLPKNTLTLKPNQTESAWITWSVPKAAPAGKYTGMIQFRYPDHAAVAGLYVEVEITVRDFTLPDENHVSAIYDVRFGPGGDKYWGGPVRTFEKEIVEFMTENRLSPDGIMASPAVTFENDKPVFDWTEFDKAAEWGFNERKMRVAYMPMFFYEFGWGHPPKDFFGEKPYPGAWPFKGTDFSMIRPEYRAKYQAVLREFWKHVTEKGWADKFVLYVSDEPNYWTPEVITQMKAVCEMIHEVDPKIPIYSSTWRYVPEWDKSLNVWGIGHYGIVPVETMKKIKEEDGSRIWFTTDGMLCLDTPHNAIERLLPYYCFKYGADAYEFWGVAWLTYDPYEYGSHAYIHQSSTPGEYYWVRYPNGDGYMIYPPLAGSKKIVSSIRFEQAREGVEDFEYFYMLSNLIDKAKKGGKDVSKAEAALDEARSMVECPSPIGRYSSKILPNPYRIYEIRRQVADAIESLGEHRSTTSSK